MEATHFALGIRCRGHCGVRLPTLHASLQHGDDDSNDVDAQMQQTLYIHGT
jgi:hypothetical protein